MIFGYIVNRFVRASGGHQHNYGRSLDYFHRSNAQKKPLDAEYALEVDGYFVIAGEGEAFHDHAFSKGGVANQVTNPGNRPDRRFWVGTDGRVGVEIISIVRY